MSNLSKNIVAALAAVLVLTFGLSFMAAYGARSASDRAEIARFEMAIVDKESRIKALREQLAKQCETIDVLEAERVEQDVEMEALEADNLQLRGRLSTHGLRVYQRYRRPFRPDAKLCGKKDGAGIARRLCLFSDSHLTLLKWLKPHDELVELKDTVTRPDGHVVCLVKCRDGTRGWLFKSQISVIPRQRKNRSS